MNIRQCFLVASFLVGALTLAACGSVPRPQELVDAHTAYERVSTSKAQQLRPDEVHEAKLALDLADMAYADDPGAERTRDLSYVALRRAELAESESGIAAAKEDREKAGKELLQLQALGLQKVQGELSSTKQQLAATGEKLEAERKARQEAMDKLAVAAALAVKDEPRGTVITLPGNVLFASGKWVLLREAQNKLDAVAQALKDQDDHKMVVEGHTDSQGKETDNLELATKRAQAVRDYLVAKGVASDHISAVGIGQSRPVASNATPEGRAQNRRVEIIVQPLEKR